ncbi:MAG TPA: hypothetical protein P5556_06280 [Candidatus Gastranaerophilales bacterium]|nr:hypothetical protein [Candidatus Gastranaerophilales bacterium]
MQKELKIRGHIIDSLILSKILDEISDMGIICYAKEVSVGQKRQDMSEAIFIIEENDDEKMQKAIKTAKKHGATEN